MKEEFENLKAKHHELLLKCAEKEVDKVQDKSNHAAFDENDFRNNDDKVRFFTGLTNWEVLEKLFLFVKRNLVGHPSLTPFQQLIITLMRLRLASSGVELSYHFGIHPPTASRVFSDVIQMLYIRLKFLIVWPEREVLRKTLPMDFRKNCPNCVVTSDCFEIYIVGHFGRFARGGSVPHHQHHHHY